MRCVVPKALFKYARRPKGVSDKTVNQGIKVEMEHTRCRGVARTIALQHLAEKKDYYSRLKRARL